jgi:hypothetical protein
MSKYKKLGKLFLASGLAAGTAYGGYTLFNTPEQ